VVILISIWIQDPFTFDIFIAWCLGGQFFTGHNVAKWSTVGWCVFQKNQSGGTGQQPNVFKPHPEHMPGTRNTLAIWHFIQGYHGSEEFWKIMNLELLLIMNWKVQKLNISTEKSDEFG